MSSELEYVYDVLIPFFSVFDEVLYKCDEGKFVPLDTGRRMIMTYYVDDEFTVYCTFDNNIDGKTERKNGILTAITTPFDENVHFYKLKKASEIKFETDDLFQKFVRRYVTEDAIGNVFKVSLFKIIKNGKYLYRTERW